MGGAVAVLNSTISAMVAFDRSLTVVSEAFIQGTGEMKGHEPNPRPCLRRTLERFEVALKRQRHHTSPAPE